MTITPHEVFSDGLHAYSVPFVDGTSATRGLNRVGTRRGAAPPFRTSPQDELAPAKPALE